MKKQKGYSMIVLVIAITVILILAATSISALQVSREKTSVTNFIYDLNTVEEMVQDFYTTNGTLPVKTFEAVDMNDLNQTSVGILSQLYVYDNENYYYIDLSQLGTMSLKDSERGYIVNEGSLKVYVDTGIEYASAEDTNTKITHYTLTSNLVNGLDHYVKQDEEMLVVGNPISWVPQADLRLVLPQYSLEGVGASYWDDWKFKWDFGPKAEAEFDMISDTDTVKSFKYGDNINIKSNGIYSVYAQNPKGEVTILNVNVSKIDDVKPVYKFINENGKMRIQLADNETGLKSVKYKTLKHYNENVASGKETNDLEGRTEVDYYLADGEGKDLIYDLKFEIDSYISQRNTIQKSLEDEIQRHDKWLKENDMSLFTEDEIREENSNHQNLVLELNNQLTELNLKYPYLFDIKGTSEDSRLVVFVEDYAGNGRVIGHMDVLSTEILADSYNISLGALGNSI